MVFGRTMVLLSLLFASPFWTAHAQSRCEPEKVAAKYPAYAGKVVKIAVSPSQPPYAFADPQNPENMVGLEVELIEKVMACAGLKHEFVKGSWSGLLAALFTGASDVMIGAVNYRPDRGERANFVVYMRAGQSIEVQKGNPKKVTGPASLCGMTGSATLGSSSALQIERQNQTCLSQNQPGITFLPSPDGNAASRQVANARIDFVMDDAVSAAIRATKEQGFDIAYTVTTDILSGMVVTKSNMAMLQIVADGMKVQESDGTLASLARKYGLPQELLAPVQVP